MSNISRRQFAAIAAGAPLAGMVNVGVAAADDMKKPPTALYDFPVGNYRMTALLDGVTGLSSDLYLSDDKEALRTQIETFSTRSDTVFIPISAFLLRSADRTILIDAGTGGLDVLGPGLGQVGASLAALGVQPEEVDAVVVTHAHPDHLGGLVGAGGPVFPNAELIVGEVEHGFWSDPAMRAAAPESGRGFFDLATSVFGLYGSRLTLAADGEEILPGLTFLLSPGHTPGHGLVMIDGGDQQLLMVADSLHSVDLHMANPDLGFGFDVDPTLAAQSRRRVFDMVSSDNMLIAGSHIHFPGVGRVRRAGDAFSFVAVTMG